MGNFGTFTFREILAILGGLFTSEYTVTPIWRTLKLSTLH